MRKDFQLGPSYTNAIIKKRILETARDEIKESDADVWFDFKMVTMHPKHDKRKPMLDTVRLFIKTTRPGGVDNQKVINQTIYRWLNIAMDYEGYYTDKAFEVIIHSDRREEVYNRLCFWDDQIASGEKTTEHVKNSIKKMLREDFPEVELKKKKKK